MPRQANRRIRRIRDDSHDRGCRDYLLEQFQTFATQSRATLLWPVKFPRGCARLATNPVATGSPTFANTMGIPPVAAFTAAVAGVVIETRTSGCRPTSSSARIDKRAVPSSE